MDFSLRVALWTLLVSAGAAFALPSAAEPVFDPYVGIQGGIHLWPAYSNRDEVEADTGPGYAWAVVGGLDLRQERGAANPSPRLRIVERLGGRLEIEVGQRFSGIHGINDGAIQRTGDGKTLQATHAGLNLWPDLELAPGWRVYVGGGGGGTWIRALGSDKRVWSYQIGLGVLIDLPTDVLPLRVDLGWRSFFASSVKLRDALADYDTHGGIVGLQLQF